MWTTSDGHVLELPDSSLREIVDRAGSPGGMTLPAASRGECGGCKQRLIADEIAKAVQSAELVGTLRHKTTGETLPVFVGKVGDQEFELIAEWNPEGEGEEFIRFGGFRGRGRFGGGRWGGGRWGHGGRFGRSHRRWGVRGGGDQDPDEGGDDDGGELEGFLRFGRILRVRPFRRWGRGWGYRHRPWYRGGSGPGPYEPIEDAPMPPPEEGWRGPSDRWGGHWGRPGAVVDGRPGYGHPGRAAAGVRAVEAPPARPGGPRAGAGGPSARPAATQAGSNNAAPGQAAPPRPAPGGARPQGAATAGEYEFP